MGGVGGVKVEGGSTATPSAPVDLLPNNVVVKLVAKAWGRPVGAKGVIIGSQGTHWNWWYRVLLEGVTAPIDVPVIGVKAEVPGWWDRLVITSGELKGQVGEVIGIQDSNNGKGIIKTADSGIQIVDLATCAKLAY